MLIREYQERYYIQTNNGYMFPIQHFDLSKNNRHIATEFFG